MQYPKNFENRLTQKSFRTLSEKTQTTTEIPFIKFQRYIVFIISENYLERRYCDTE